MKVANVVQQAIDMSTSEEGAQEMSIDADSSVFLMDALGKLYSQPARAALREYLSNAIDAHIEAGGDLPPVEVTLPSVYSENLAIRDYGQGMSEHTFNNVLSRYGASTKRDSNKVHGGFGLGAKAGFAVSQFFHMTSYQNGKLVKVRIFKNETGKGFLEVVERANTSEPDGLLVEIPIPTSNQIELELSSLSDDNFFEAYSSDEITVSLAGMNNTSKIKSVHSESFEKLEMGGVVLGWVSKKPSQDNVYDNVRAIIGRVSYTVRTDSFGYSDALYKLYTAGYTVILNLPIGSVDLPSSREEITYSERSIKTISAIASSVLRLIEEKVQGEVNAMNSRFEALSFVSYLAKVSFPNADQLTWRGEIMPLLIPSERYKSASFNFEGSATLFVKLPSGRPSLVETDMHEVSPGNLFSTIAKSDSNTLISVFVEGEAAYNDALKKIRTSITDYRKSLQIGKATLNVLVFRSDESLAEWFKQGKQVSMVEFKAAVRDYRANLRKAAQNLVASSSNPDETPLVISSRKIHWLGLDAIGQQSHLTEGDEAQLLTGATNFYYLAMSEVNSTYGQLYHFHKATLKSPGGYDMDYSGKQQLIAIKGVLGEDAKLVFLSAGRSTSIFAKNFPNVKPLISTMREKLLAEWQEVKTGQKKGENLVSAELWKIQDSRRVDSISSFIKTLTSEEKATLDPALLEIDNLMGETHRYGTSFSDLLTYEERNEITQWSEAKVDAISSRYPLLPLIFTHDHKDWMKMKEHLYSYIQSH